MSPQPSRPVCLLIAALGGEGGGVLTNWIVDAAQTAGYPVQATSIPGVAQRTGATTYYVEIWPQTLAESGGRRRQSMAFFHNTSFDARIECIPTCLAPGEAPKYPPVLAGRYLIDRFTSAVNE